MRIVIAHPRAEAREQWVRMLGELLPQARIEGWAPGSAPADYAIGWLDTPGFFDEQTRLRAIFSAGAGVDHLMKQPGLPPRLPVVRLEDAGMGPQMIEYCLHEILRVQRRFDDYAAAQRESAWRPLPALARADLTVGVFGLGVLGAQVASALADFGYPVRGYSRSPKSIDGVECFDERSGLQSFLGGCRMLVLLAPLTETTRGLFDAQRLAWLPAGASLVNVARGPLIDDDALLEALDSGHLASATLDVFGEEPLPPGHPFWRHPKIRITPHVSAMTMVEESAPQVARKILALERGEAVGGLVDRRRGY
ncbi:MAG TPA: glyoxylate/hydroxypyruvate reductase A [Burkholderiaceae bacterium]|nr:glyoxylate/hydroxypyruvate reductase A [Burkholderiaceae bacterium]